MISIRKTIQSWDLLLAVLLLLMLFLTACQSGPVASAAVVDIAEIADTASTPTTVPLPPPVLSTVTQSINPTVDLPSFSLVSPEELAATTEAVPSQAPPSLTPTASATATASPSATPSPTNTSTPTPLPTFTPPALPLTSQDEHYWLRRPVADGGVVWTDKSYPYGHTLGGTLRPHHGVEFAVPTGTEILAAASGTVRVAGSDAATPFGPHTDFYGNLVVIELDSRLNGQPVFNLYGHLSEVFVSEGKHVQAEEVIALSGSSGVADGPHMHFEVRVGANDYENTRNPLLWLYPFRDKGSVAGRVVWPNGQLVNEAPVRLRRVDAASNYAATTTYAAGSINADEGWNENFALDDVEAGYYEVIVNTGAGKAVEMVWVFPFRTSFVEITLDPANTTGTE